MLVGNLVLASSYHPEYNWEEQKADTSVLPDLSDEVEDRACGFFCE